MFHVRVSPSLVSQCGAFTALVFQIVVFLTLIPSCRGQSAVIGPSEPIVATVGEDVTLPCYLDPAVDAFDMTLEWTQSDLDPRFVIVQRDGLELKNIQHPSFAGRVSFFTEELQRGNISLKLSKVKLSDAGRFRCFSPLLDQDATVQLVVGASSSPDVQMTKTSSVVVLRCESAGWYPEPELSWLDGKGNLLPAEPTETVRGPDGLYTVSSRVTVDKRHSNKFTCRVQQKNIDQTRETHIHVPDDFFAVSPDSSSASSVPVIIGLIVGILIIPAAVFAVWKWRQNKSRNKKHHEDEETQKVSEKKRNSISNKSEKESLMGREADRQPTEERRTINTVDTFKVEADQTQVDQETHQRESNDARRSVAEGRELQTRQTDQPSAEGETNNGLEDSQERTETKTINLKRETPNPAERESGLNNDEYETQSVSDNTERPTENNLQTEEEEKTESLFHTGDKGHHEDEETQKVSEKKRNSISNKSEQESLMGREADRQPTEERRTINTVDTFKVEADQTQVDQETQQRESNDARRSVAEGRELQTRQTDQPSAEGETNNGLEDSQERTETKTINLKRETPNPAERESGLNNDEYETQSVSDNTERPTENNLQTEEEEKTESLFHTGDKGHHEDEETQKVSEKKRNSISNKSEQESLMGREADRQPTEERRTINTVDTFKVEADQTQVDQETQQRQSDLNKKEDETQSVSDNTERRTENNLQTEEEQKTESVDDEAEVEEEDGELSAERETAGDRDEEKEKLKNKLKSKEREMKKFEEKVSRFEGQMKSKEQQIKQLKVKLEETQKKLHSVSREEDKDERLKLDLEKEEAELLKELGKAETKLNELSKGKDNMTQRKSKAEKEKENIIKELEKLETGRNTKAQVDDLSEDMENLKL